MTDDLDRLKAALKSATPQPDADARTRALALARKISKTPKDLLPRRVPL